MKDKTLLAHYEAAIIRAAQAEVNENNMRSSLYTYQTRANNFEQELRVCKKDLEFARQRIKELDAKLKELRDGDD